MALRKSQFWLDNSGGTLVDVSTELNNVGVDIGRELLDDTGLNEDWVSRIVGIRDGQMNLSGYCGQLNTGIIKALLAAENTSVTKTFQWKVGTRYLNGEALVGLLKLGEADGKKIIPFNTSLMVDGAINETGVAL